MDMMPQESGAMPQTAPEAPSASVTITKTPDGAYTVESAAMAPEMGQPGAEDMSMSQPQLAATIDEAFELARAILEGGDGMSAEQAFSSGFEGQTQKAY
ncbi:MAG: hypothetical protein V4772_08580 [Pseudomonadota bacterium]